MKLNKKIYYNLKLNMIQYKEHHLQLHLKNILFQIRTYIKHAMVIS